MENKDFLSVIKNRRSIRMFKPDEVSDKLIKESIDLARWAPSGANCQPWRFIVIKDPVTKKNLSEVAKASFFQINRHICEAPVIIVACSNSKASNWHLYDTTNATMCLLLAIEYLGLGSCWIGLFNEEKVKEILEVPNEWKIITLIPLGYPKETPSVPPRMEPEEITFYEKWGKKRNGNKNFFKINICKKGVPSVLGKAVRHAIRCGYSQMMEIFNKKRENIK